MKIPGRIVQTQRAAAICGHQALEEFGKFLKAFDFRRKKVFVLVDENTEKHCLPLLRPFLSHVRECEVIAIRSGEQQKTLDTAIILYNELLGKGAGRDSLLVNLGGGVITDLGGFVASTVKRGIPYVNIPTTLMAQVDASIGGKTAVNIGPLKNQAGTFTLPLSVFIFPGFLSTLDTLHVRSGFAEIVKTALISDTGLWKKIRNTGLSTWKDIPFTDKRWEEMIAECVLVKTRIVQRDFTEKNDRKILNFGHTFGHALESFSLAGDLVPVSHGHAVAMGMIIALYISYQRFGLDRDFFSDTCAWLLGNWPHYPIPAGKMEDFVKYLSFDKKSTGGLLRLTLLREPGGPVVNQFCSAPEIAEAIDFYNSLGV